MARPVRKTRRRFKNIKEGVAHIYASYNNTIVTLSDNQGNVISWSSAGAQGFKGSRKSTPYAAQIAASAAGVSAREHGMEKLSVRIKGAGPGREAAVRALAAQDFAISLIQDITPIPHNGCRQRKKRRV